MHRIRRIALASLLAAAPAVPLVASQVALAAPASKQPPHKSPPVSAEHKKALAELYGGFKFGMSKDEVVAVFSKQLDERYDEKIKATTDINEQDRLRRDKRDEVDRLSASYIAFDTPKPSPWDVSIVEGEFAHTTGEAMLEQWENQGKNQRRFFFFHDGKLWKMYVQLDVSVLPEDKRTFGTFQSVMENRYGAGDIGTGVITWRTPEFEVRAVDKLKSYDSLAMVIEDPRARTQVLAIREAKAPPKRAGASVIQQVVDPNHSDHPDVHANGNAVDTVIRAQGGTPPKSP